MKFGILWEGKGRGVNTVLVSHTPLMIASGSQNQAHLPHGLIPQEYSNPSLSSNSVGGFAVSGITVKNQAILIPIVVMNILLCPVNRGK